MLEGWQRSPESACCRHPPWCNLCSRNAFVTLFRPTGIYNFLRLLGHSLPFPREFYCFDLLVLIMVVLLTGCIYKHSIYDRSFMGDNFTLLQHPIELRNQLFHDIRPGQRILEQPNRFRIRHLIQRVNNQEPRKVFLSWFKNWFDRPTDCTAFGTCWFWISKYNLTEVRPHCLFLSRISASAMVNGFRVASSSIHWNENEPTPSATLEQANPFLIRIW